MVWGTLAAAVAGRVAVSTAGAGSRAEVWVGLREAAVRRVWEEFEEAGCWVAADGCLERETLSWMTL